MWSWCCEQDFNTNILNWIPCQCDFFFFKVKYWLIRSQYFPLSLPKVLSLPGMILWAGWPVFSYCLQSAHVCPLPFSSDVLVAWSKLRIHNHCLHLSLAVPLWGIQNISPAHARPWIRPCFKLCHSHGYQSSPHKRLLQRSIDTNAPATNEGNIPSSNWRYWTNSQKH